jgi:arabinofuranosyltransferase
MGVAAAGTTSGATASTSADPDVLAMDRGAPRSAAVRSAALAARFASPAAVVVTFLGTGWARRFTTDDAFINYRVVKQVMAGNGPVFNVGERVEVTTSTLWFVVLMVADVLSPLRLEWTSILLGLALGGLGLAAGMAGALRLGALTSSSASRVAVVVPVGAIAYMGVAAAWDWATGGLELGLALAWLGTSFLGVVSLVAALPATGSGGSPRRLLAGGVLVGLGPLVRPDFVVLSVGLAVPLVVVAWRRGGRRRVATLAVAGLAAPAAVQLFRMGYYGQLLPNTIYAKEGMTPWWDQGWRYLRNFAAGYWLPIPVAAVLAWVAAGLRGPDRGARPTAGGSARWGDWRLVVIPLEAAAVAHAVGIVRAGGDYMHGRLLLPAWFCLLLPLLAVRAHRLLDRRTIVAATVLVVWALVSAAWFRPPRGSLMPPSAHQLLTPEQLAASPTSTDGIIDQRTATLGGAFVDDPVLLEDFMPPRETAGWYPADPAGHAWFHPLHLPPGSGRELMVRDDLGRSVVPVAGLGAGGYSLPLDVHVYDRLGLADPATARVALDRRAEPGHEKALSATWIAAMFLDDDAVVVEPEQLVETPLIFTVVVGVDVAVPHDTAAFADERTAAADALACGRLGELRDNARAPLTAGRFLGNMVDALRLHDFRFPSDPATARDELCP